PAARAGYPLVTVPAGYVYGLPVGVTFMGRAWDEGTLIRLASGFEAVTQVRQTPHFVPTHARCGDRPATHSARFSAVEKRAARMSDGWRVTSWCSGRGAGE